ncbi:MAG: secondary thiamine-phosphate synthase enzyme YjbQ [Anaerosomatales bacterium]|nr:secondary thiamine-phosphate synthase enzyme YjbQ [Anaerosomatales bacterium]MDT8433707.1 secondary thiamine-phosphate synthase enzyme YjbQ [Anaerosomatales bacterium]
MMEIEVRTQRREQLVDVTAQVAGALAASGVAEGIAHIWCPHTTAGITVNEAPDPSVAEDIVEGLGRLVPRDAAWRHAEGNSDAHLKASLVGASASVPVSGL